MRYDLTSPSVVKHLCEAFGFSFKKSFGQNFLTDGTVLRRISEEAKGEGILEIGPGFGTLTTFLSEQAEKVVSVEIDQTLEKVLNITLEDCDNVKLLFEDILKTDVKSILENEFKNMQVNVAANLPYYVTTPILMKLLEGKYSFNKIVVMVQKEVADRIVAKPGKKDYGALSLAVSYFAEAEIITNVPADKFIPSPKVDSAVVSMTLLSKPPIKANEKTYFKVIKAAFAQRRKTLLNALSNSGAFGNKERIKMILEELGYDLNTRGETLSMEQFSDLAEKLDT